MSGMIKTTEINKVDESLTKSALFEAFDLLPGIIDTINDLLTVAPAQETTRIGDVSSTALALRQKYMNAINLLHSYEGIEASVEEQEMILQETQENLEQFNKTLEFYSTTLFRGSCGTRPDVNDAFARSIL
uniref:Mediator of RNA polymerase II transcription subunit 9 n=1 Tax=Albugo laibachii Nc14 TaxID=890382 RepID=F0X0N7_9STRA|nr:hypothetical protein PITG_09539 [Albugo laibachii Nc14]|eukprot:CCA27330.1 hypothetical protein PITG_09539 [Albugo laibachii Nc14]